MADTLCMRGMLKFSELANCKNFQIAWASDFFAAKAVFGRFCALQFAFRLCGCTRAMSGKGYARVSTNVSYDILLHVQLLQKTPIAVVTV